MNDPFVSLTIGFSCPPFILCTACAQMVARLRAEIQELKDELSLATGEQRTDDLTDEEKEKLVSLLSTVPLIVPCAHVECMYCMTSMLQCTAVQCRTSILWVSCGFIYPWSTSLQVS